MELKRLDKDGLTAIYRQRMVYDFPRGELKPLKAMLNMLDKDNFDPLIAEEHGEMLGYAVVWKPEGGSGALLEYLGVRPDKRNSGLGATILDLLAERYGQIFCEAEAPTSENPVENDLRRRRIGFYERKGFRVLDYTCALFGVHYNCLYRGPETDDRAVERLHRSVYTGWFSPAHFDRFIQLPLKPGEAIKPAPEWVEEDGE